MRFSFVLNRLSIVALCVMMCAVLSQDQAMNHKPSSGESPERQSSSGTASAQTGSGTAQPDGGEAAAMSDLEKYPDQPVASIPTQPVSLRYVVEHRSGLNGKTITVRGLVARTLGLAGSAAQGEQSMANPQPRIFLADNLRKQRDKHFDLMVLLREGERGYAVGQKVRLKVRVDASKASVILRKIS
ncbi:MAG TPA: hypothetical protein VGC91_17425 [Pyrinomonadaceae bacterium]|jgi:hypothetical protein